MEINISKRKIVKISLHFKSNNHDSKCTELKKNLMGILINVLTLCNALEI